MSTTIYQGQVAIVTGAGKGSGGLGRAIAMRLAAGGAKLMVSDVDAKVAESAGEIASETGAATLAFAGSLAVEDNVKQMVAQAMQAWGRIDILINNAGTIRRTPAVDFSEDDWATVIEVNLSSVFRLSQAAGRHMIEQGSGKIVNIASLLSFQGGITVPAYTASKSGVAGLTKALANEWAKHNINVNAIAPGYISTDNTTALRTDETRNRQILERIPAGRWGNPDDLAGAAVFLSSAASDYMQGHILTVDGGWMAR